MSPIKNVHVTIMFPHKRKSKKRLEFMFKTCFLNSWDDWEDYKICMRRYKPDFERLYQHYKKTELVPYFNDLMVSFVKHVDEFVELKKDIMFVVSEDLMYNWQAA